MLKWSKRQWNSSWYCRWVVLYWIKSARWVGYWIINQGATRECPVCGDYLGLVRYIMGGCSNPRCSEYFAR